MHRAAVRVQLRVLAVHLIAASRVLRRYARDKSSIFGVKHAVGLQVQLRVFPVHLVAAAEVLNVIEQMSNAKGKLSVKCGSSLGYWPSTWSLPAESYIIL